MHQLDEKSKITKDGGGVKRFISIAAKQLAFWGIILPLVILPARPALAYDNVVIVIDPGHGGVVTEDNSNGGCMYNNLCEKDVNLITATALYNELSQYKNITVYITRTADVELSLEQRIAFAQSVNADVMVSVHYNACSDHNFYGGEIFTSMYGKCRATGYGLASCIMQKWEDFGTVCKGIRTRKGNNGDYYGLIRQGKEIDLPVIILEHGYLDNDNDFSRMSGTEEWQKLGVLDATGIAEYYGLRKDLVQGSITPTVSVQSYAAPALPDETAPESVKLVVDEYNEETGEIKYSLSAAEDGDDLMYYGIQKGPITDETVFSDLILWDNSKGVQTGEITVPAEYSGLLTARVYNSYELYTDSESIDLSTVNDKPDENADEGPDASDDPLGKSDADDFAEGSDELEILDTIVVDSVSSEHIDITPDMVDEAENAVSIENKAKIGLAIAGAVVALGVVIAFSLGVYKMVLEVKKDKKKSRKKYDWERYDDH